MWRMDVYRGFPDEDHNPARSRVTRSAGRAADHLGWAFAWPSNRRKLYNRASADPEGVRGPNRSGSCGGTRRRGSGPATTCPISSEQAARLSPGLEQEPGRHGSAGRADPFIMIADGKCLLFVPSGLKDGPLPTHYEPLESPMRESALSPADQSCGEALAATGQ